MELPLSCQHQHIVTFLGATWHDKFSMILMELMDFNQEMLIDKRWSQMIEHLKLLVK